MFAKVFLLTAFLAFGCVASEKPKIRFSDEENAKIAAAFQICLENTKYKMEDIINAFGYSKYPTDEEYQKVMHCGFEKAGRLVGGRVNVENIVGLFPADVDIRDIITTCAQEVGKNDVETLFKFFVCYDKKTPVAIDFSS